MSDFLRACEERLPDLLTDLEQLIRHESPSKDLAAVAGSAALVAEIGTRRLGEAPESLVLDGCTHLRWRFGTGPRQVLVLCHHDTVWPVGSLAEHPWSYEDDVIRGPGCFDMKTGIVMAFHALAVLGNRHGSLEGVTLLVTGDEEIGSPTSRELIESEAAGCAAALVLEASGPDGALKTERKGTSMYELSITGRAAHAGLEPERGVNAGLELAHQILAVSAIGSASAESGTTVTPTVAQAGTTLNTVPASASLQVDVRARTDAEQRQVDAQIRGLRPVLDGAALEVSGQLNRPPLMAESSAELFERAKRLAPEAGIEELRSVAVGGASDGNFTAGVGTPTLDGLGAVGGGAHAADEHVVVSAIPSRVALLVLLGADLLGRGHRTLG